MDNVRSDAAHRSHTAAWIAAVLAVPFLYIVSVPPICMAMSRGKPPADPFAHAPYVDNFYYQPYVWLRHNTPLRRPLDRYEEMWLTMLLQ